MEAFVKHFCHFMEFSEWLEEIQNEHCNQKLSVVYYAQLRLCPQT